MDDNSTSTISRGIDLRASAERVPVDHPLSLIWQVHGHDAARSNVQLASADEAGLEVIESMSHAGHPPDDFHATGSAYVYAHRRFSRWGQAQ